jgi:hypothetical protein
MKNLAYLSVNLQIRSLATANLPNVWRGKKFIKSPVISIDLNTQKFITIFVINYGRNFVTLS